MAHNRVSLTTSSEKLHFLAKEVNVLLNAMHISFNLDDVLNSDHLKDALVYPIFRYSYNFRGYFKDVHDNTDCLRSMLDILIESARLDLLKIIQDIYHDELIGLQSQEIKPGYLSSFNRSIFLLKQKLNYYPINNNPEELSRADAKEKLLRFYLDLFHKRSKPLPFDLSVLPLELKVVLEKLFGKKTDYSALEEASAKVIQLFSHPAKYVPYLQYIEYEFDRYNRKHTGKSFPKFSSHKKYDFKLLDGYEYPIPNENFGDGMTKFSMLQEFLMMFLRQAAGWGKQDKALQWVGFIPNEIANQLLLEDVGAFVTEGRLNEGLFHGKLSHMLQFALIAVAIKDNFISNVTLHEIIDFAVHHNMYQLNSTLWQQMFDWANLTGPTLSNPYLLHTLIMRHGHHELATPSLATYMIDTFCKGYKKLTEFLNKNNHEFLTKLEDRILNMFSAEQVLKNYINQYKGGNVKKATDEKSYVVFEKKYKPKSLALSSFQLFATEQSLKLNNQETTANMAFKKNHTSMM